jgi:U3 small nucleolar RNA-associated protein 20
MHDLRDGDVSIRNHAIKLITLILCRIKDVAACKGGAATLKAGGGHVAGQMIGTAQGKGAAEWEVYLEIIYAALKKNLGDAQRGIRNEAFKLVLRAAAEFVEFHSDLGGLTHVDPEQDISLNLLHIQMHRRIKALMSLQKVIEAGGITPTSLRYILMPLIWWNMIEPQDKESGGKAYSADDGAYNLADEAVRTAGAIALQLPWKDYQVMLWDALRHLSLQRPYEKIVVKLVCAMIANFHFELDASGEALVQHYSHVLGVTDTPTAKLAAAAAAAVRDDAEADSKRRHSQVAQRFDTGDDADDEDPSAEVQEGVSSGAVAAPKGTMLEVGGADLALKGKAELKQQLGSGKTGEPADVYLHVVYRLMPELEKHMTERAVNTGVDKRVQQGKLRPGIAVAVVKMLKLLPEERMRARLPHIIGVVCNGLRVREQSDRDATRKTLADMMRCLGPLFLNFVLGEVKSNLSVGYQRHVCGYTFHAILDALQDLLHGAHLAPSLPLILEVFLSELHGTIAEEKEVDKIVAKTREAKSTKAYDCMEVIGKVAVFCT